MIQRRQTSDAPALYQVKLLSIYNVAKNTTALQASSNNSEPQQPVIPLSKQSQTLPLPNDTNNTYSNQTMSNTENNFTQNTQQNNTGNLDQNYTNEINFTTEGQILKAFKGLGGNLTLNSTG